MPDYSYNKIWEIFEKRGVWGVGHDPVCDNHKNIQRSNFDKKDNYKRNIKLFQVD